MAHYMSDIIDPEDRDKLHENLLVGPGKLPMEVSLVSTLSYLLSEKLFTYSFYALPLLSFYGVVVIVKIRCTCNIVIENMVIICTILFESS